MFQFFFRDFENVAFSHIGLINIDYTYRHSVLILQESLTTVYLVPTITSVFECSYFIVAVEELDFQPNRFQITIIELPSAQFILLRLEELFS